MKFSVVIPAHNEEGNIENTILALQEALEGKFDFEIIVIADHCTDSTEAILSTLAPKISTLKWFKNSDRNGFGMAIRCGLNHYTGDAVAIFMADASDSPNDLLIYFEKIEAGAECVFGSRFIKGSVVTDYPKYKLFLNRIVNFILRVLFRHGTNDTTNAFKCYRREVIEGCRPYISRHFNLTIEIPLKAVIRGYSFETIPISWTNRVAGVSKLKLKEMGSRYFFTLVYCYLEKLLTGQDYKREHH